MPYLQQFVKLSKTNSQNELPTNDTSNIGDVKSTEVIRIKKNTSKSRLQELMRNISEERAENSKVTQS
jgi:hypothetical protein